ncbi:MAG: hypothetical protein H8E47_12075 [Anaerolineales bacterium]|nr:hypothetical protein [Anaerolineales bacterium]
MDRETITAESLLRDIYEAESALRWFEQKYGLLSETFYRVYQQGQLRDEDPDEIQEYMEWSGWYEIRQDRRQRYEQAADFLSAGWPCYHPESHRSGIHNQPKQAS